jgi:HEAT repeat protein
MLEMELPASSSEADRKFLTQEVELLGYHAKRYTAHTSFLEDPLAVQILVVAMRDPSPLVRGVAFRALTPEPQYYGAKARDLAANADGIKEALRRFDFPDKFYLFSLLPLTSGERAELLAIPDLPKSVRARLGDTQAEDACIEKFERARTFDEKRSWASALGYVGTRRAGEALARALGSDLVHEFGGGGKASIRVDIIEALGRIHDEEPLLTSEILKIQGAGDDRYGGPEKVREYLQRVHAWAQATYGITLPTPEATPLLVQEGAGTFRI